MGKFRKCIEQEKMNMPEYQYNFLYKKVMPGFVFVLGGAILICIIFVIFALTGNSQIIPCILLGVWVIITSILLILFVINVKKLSKRLLNDKTREIESEFELIDYGTAVENLEKEKIIIDYQIILNDIKISLDECVILFYCKTWGGAFYFNFNFYSKKDYSLIKTVNLDENAYTFFNREKNRLINKDLFELFINDKRKFLELLYKYNDINKMQKHIK